MEITREEYLNKAVYAVGVPLALTALATIAETLQDQAKYDAMMSAQTNNYNMLFSPEPLNKDVMESIPVNLAQFIPDMAIEIAGQAY